MAPYVPMVVAVVLEERQQRPWLETISQSQPAINPTCSSPKRHPLHVSQQVASIWTGEKEGWSQDAPSSGGSEWRRTPCAKWVTNQGQGIGTGKGQRYSGLITGAPQNHCPPSYEMSDAPTVWLGVTVTGCPSVV